jgi:DNA polymerase, archaea type
MYGAIWMTELQVLDVRYFFDSGEPVIQIYGKTRDGSTKVLGVTSFEPYFYADAEPDHLEEVSKVIEQEGFEARPVQRYRPIGWQSKPTEMLKIVTSTPKDIKDNRNWVESLPGVNCLYEADLQFKTRYMVDAGIVGMGWINDDNGKSIDILENAPLRHLFFDIEVLPPEDGSFPDSEKDPVIMISMAFTPSFNGLSDLVLVADSRDCDRKDVVMCGDEQGVLDQFVETIKQYDPDIISGYNINDFDFPYLQGRMLLNGILPDIGRDGQAWFISEMANSKNVSIAGRVVIDMLQIIRKDTGLIAQYSLKQHDLRTVAKVVLGMEKLDVPAKDMRNYWSSHDNRFKNFVSYARRDAVLVARLMFKLNIMDKYIALAQSCGALLQDVINGRQSVLIENLQFSAFQAG